MDIRHIYIVEVRAEGSDEALVRINGLNEAECNKVFDRIQFPDRGDGEGYDKLMLWNRGKEEVEVIRRSPLVKATFKPISAKQTPHPELPPIKPSNFEYSSTQRMHPELSPPALRSLIERACLSNDYSILTPFSIRVRTLPPDEKMVVIKILGSEFQCENNPEVIKDFLFTMVSSQ